MSPPRWVLDTNVLLSALLFPSGRITWLRHAWRKNEIVPLASRDTVTELIRVLGYPKFGLTGREREDLLEDYLVFAEAVTVPEGVSLPECRDPFDQPFLELALAGRADALVTGDNDLLVLADEFGIPILSPGAARRLLRHAGPR